jgi:ribosomal protein L34
MIEKDTLQPSEKKRISLIRGFRIRENPACDELVKS